MKRVGVTQLKNRLSYYLRLVKRGETIEVLERSIPVARLEGIQGKPGDGDAHLSRLVRDGIVTPRRKEVPEGVRKAPPLPCKVDPVRVLIDQRGDR